MLYSSIELRAEMKKANVTNNCRAMVYSQTEVSEGNSYTEMILMHLIREY